MHTATSSLYYPSRSAKFGAPTARWKFKKFSSFRSFRSDFGFQWSIKRPWIL